jgi:uncharacterized protein YjbI with pentapeptide repeats
MRENKQKMRRVLMLAVLTLGMLLVGVSQAAAQDCKELKDTSEARDCWLKKVQSGEKNLAGAYLVELEVSADDVNFMNADLTSANLSKAYLAGVHFTGAILKGANFVETDLTETTFFKTSLAGVNLSGANLTKANLAKANFLGADLTGANLTDAVLTGAVVNKTTKGIDLEEWKKRGAFIAP